MARVKSAQCAASEYGLKAVGEITFIYRQILASSLFMDWVCWPLNNFFVPLQKVLNTRML